MKTQNPSHAKAKAKAKAQVSTPLQPVEPDAAGIDLGATEIWVAVPGNRTPEPVRRFGAFTKDLEALVQHLQACGIRSVAMELSATI